MKLFIFACLFAISFAQTGDTPKNVLFLIADDLRPDLNLAYGKDFMFTPNIDRLAKSGLVFDLAYTNFAICSPSRNSFMSGRMPDRTRVWNFINDFREAGPNWVTLPEYFKQRNYTTLGAGKLYHPGKPGDNDEPKSWSQDKPYGAPNYDGCPKVPPPLKNMKNAICTEPANAPPETWEDYKMTQTAIQYLQYASSQQKPFFIGLGFHYPHLDWHVPQWALKKYAPWNDIATAKNQDPPKNYVDVAMLNEVDGKYTFYIGNETSITGDTEIFDIPTPLSQTFPISFQKNLRAGYYAAVTLTDYHIGLILDALDSTGLANDTIVILAGDHGWQLGEHRLWGKHTNFETANHVPLIIRAPFKANSTGKHTQSFAELVDLYPTLADLAGFESNPADIDGISLAPLFDDPDQIIRDGAYSQYSRCPCLGNDQCDHPWWYENNCEQVPANEIEVMGYSVRERDWRYTEWFLWDGEALKANFSSSAGKELYDHRNEKLYPLTWNSENDNVAGDSNYSDVVQNLRAKLLHRYGR